MILDYTPQRDYGMSVCGFSKPLMVIIINADTILSMHPIFRNINTLDVTTHYIFQVEINMNCCIAWAANCIVNKSPFHCNADFFWKAFKCYTSYE